MQPTFSLAYTTIRPEFIKRVIDTWRSRASNPKDIEVVICVDANNLAGIEVANAVPDVKVVLQPEAPFNSVRGWNAAAAQTTGKILIAVADDFDPPQGWDTALLALHPLNWWDTEHVVHTEDGYVHDICVLSIMTRKRYERFGYFFYPQYESMFCDTEFTAVAYRDGVVINAKHLLFEHLHPDCNKRDRDKHDIEHASKDRWARGEMLFNYRRQIGFPIDDGPKAQIVDEKAVVASTESNDDYCVYIQATKDDFCLYEVCQRLREEGVNTFFFCVPDEYWSGAPTPAQDIAQVQDIADRLKAEGARVFFRLFDVSQYRFTGDTRIMVETRVRNDTLTWIRHEGFHHILVVDGDELWVRGLFDKVKDAIETSHPHCISAPMIPVVGVPGYPVHCASDRAVIYIDSSTVFRECRSPAVDHFLLNSGIVIHFTACRKNMQEVIDKHRASGHYDDPDYAFEDWIKNVLPNLKPGWRGAHMYRKYQIWPYVREWTRSEMDHIPANLHQYLGAPVDAASPIQAVLEPIKRSVPRSSSEPRTIQMPRSNDIKVHPFTLSQSEQFAGRSFNPFRQ